MRILYPTTASAVELALERQGKAMALRQHLQLLAGQCVIEGVDLATIKLKSMP